MRESRRARVHSNRPMTKKQSTMLLIGCLILIAGICAVDWPYWSQMISDFLNSLPP
jgi:uncharacterized membrane protein HdeD (DUF308 family)